MKRNVFPDKNSNPRVGAVAINSYLGLMSEEERELHLEHFDMVTFDQRIRTVCEEITSPLAVDTKKQLRQLAE